MEGDENLSRQAQSYTIYYGSQWDMARDKQIDYLRSGDLEGAALAQAEMDNYHYLAENIRYLDTQGKVTGSVYEVTNFDQGGYNLCWAFCQVMIENYYTGGDMTQEMAENRAIEIAKEVYGEKDWDKAGKPAGVEEYEGIYSFDELEKSLSGGPIYASYRVKINKNDTIERSGHVVVVTGAVSATGHEALVLTNNTSGGEFIQTYKEFKNQLPINKNMYLNGIAIP